MSLASQSSVDKMKRKKKKGKQNKQHKVQMLVIFLYCTMMYLFLVLLRYDMMLLHRRLSIIGPRRERSKKKKTKQ